MKSLRMLKQIMKQTGADRIWGGFLVFYLITSTAIWLLEPEIKSLGDALWYCYAVVTTLGFGDVVAQHFLSRILSILLSMYAVLTIAIVTGVVVSYFNRIAELKQEESLMALADKLKRLPELSQEELVDISEKVKLLQDKKRKSKD